MNIKWKSNKKLKPKIILEKLNEARELKEDKITYPGFELVDGEMALYSMLKFSVDVSSNTKEHLIRNVLFNTTEDLSKENFIININEEWRVFSNRKNRKFILLTSISLDKEFSIKDIELNQCKITILDGEYPVKFKSRVNIYKNFPWTKNISPENYRNVMVEISTRIESEAVKKCIEALDLFRFFICVQTTTKYSYSSGNRFLEPINKVRSGGLYTLHLEDGNLFSDKEVFWHQPNFLEINKLYKHSDYNTLRENMLSLIDWYKECTYKDELKESIICYMKGFDSIDYNQNLIIAWSALEMLLARGIERSNDLISRRCSFLWVDSNYHWQIIEHIREFRNQNIHSGEDIESTKIHCYQLQRYFNKLILFYLKTSGKYKSLDEVNKFLDMSPDVKALNKQKGLIEEAIEFRTPGRGV